MKPEARRIGNVVLAATLALGACDPCSGIVSCHVAPVASVTGQVIDYASGRAIAGATLVFAPSAGASPGVAASATTDAQGQFQLDVAATGAGAVTGDLTVRAPSFPGGYTVHGVQLAASRTRGEGVDLGRVLARPYLAFLGQVHSRFIGTSVPSSVEIKRVGGASL